MDQRIVSMDLLEYLVSNVGIFTKLDPVSRRNIFNSRPKPVLSSLVDFVKGKRFVTPFITKYYDTFPWLTACPKRQVLFCFVCLLQGHTVLSVICAKSEVVEAAQAHESTAVHMAAYDACLRSVQNVDANSNVDRAKQMRVKRKKLMGKIVQILYLLKCQAYYDKLGRDREFALETIRFMALNDVNVSIDWDTLFPELKSNAALEAAIFSTTRDLVFEHVKNELATADFASMRIVDVSEYAAKPTFSIVLRYIANDEIVERFGGFYELTDYNSKIDESSLVDILDYWDARQKLIGISCDFHADRLPDRVPGRPFRLFNVTAAGHNLKRTALKIALAHKEIRDFLGRVQRVVGCLKLLQTDGHLPSDVDWTSNLTADSAPVHTQVADLSNHLTSIVETLSRLKKDPTVGFNASLVAHTEKLLKEDQLRAYCRFFVELFDICEDFGRQDLEDLKERLWKMTASSSDSFRPPDSKKMALIGKPVSERIVEDVIGDFEIRVKTMADYAIGQLVDHISRGEAEDLKSILDPVLKETKGLIDFNLPRLKTEVQVLLKDPKNKIRTSQLYEDMAASKTLQVYAEFAKILKFHMTLPTTAATDDSIVGKIKDFARATRCTADAFKFDTLMVENRLTMKLMGDSVFMDYLLDSLSRVPSLADLFQDTGRPE